MEVRFWGVRGSFPTPGVATARWGGNTSCVEVTSPGKPPIVLDAGTGARGLGRELVARGDVRALILLSHLHVDHLLGVPFFLPLYTPGGRVTLGLPAWTPEEARGRLGRYLNGTFHPTRLADIPAEVEVIATRPDVVLAWEGWRVSAVRLNHPGGSLGYRVEADGRSVAYLTDTAPFARPGEGLAVGEAATAAEQRVVEFLQGCDLVVYDTMFGLDEYLERMSWGHSYPDYAHAICAAAGVEHLVLFHHLPDADDDTLDARAVRYADHRAPRVSQAREGDRVVLA